MSAQDEPPGRWRLQDGELISAASALLLLVTMFALAWYGVVGRSGPQGRSGLTSAENAWEGLTLVRWLMLLTVAVALGSVVLHVTQRSHGTQTDTSIAVTTLGILTAVLLVARVLIDLPAPKAVVDVKFGAFFGLLCAWGITLGGYESLRNERARRRVAAHTKRAARRLAPGGNPR